MAGTENQRGRYRRITRDESDAYRLVNTLCEEERDVLVELIDGHSFTEIADRMEISESKVEALRASILGKFGVGTTADLLRIGIYAGLQSEP